MSTDANNPGLPPAPQFSISREAGVHVVTFTDPNALDAFHVEALGEEIYAHLKIFDAPKVVLDMGNLELLSSSALGVLISLRSLMENSGGQLCLANASEGLRDILEMTKLTELLQVHEGIAEAIQSLG